MRTQRFFVFCLHPFTKPTQIPIAQHIKCEGFTPQNPSPAAYRNFTLDAGAFSVPKNAPTRPQSADEKVNIKQG